MISKVFRSPVSVCYGLIHLYIDLHQSMKRSLYPQEYEKKQIKMWKTMNDAQHMWIIGSFFKFRCDLRSWR